MVDAHLAFVRGVATRDHLSCVGKAENSYGWSARHNHKVPWVRVHS